MKTTKLYIIIVAVTLAMVLVLPNVFARVNCLKGTPEVVLASNDSGQKLELSSKGDPKPKKVIIIIVRPKPKTPKKDSVITAMPIV